MENILSLYQFVDPQREVADLLIPRGIKNYVAMCKHLLPLQVYTDVQV